MEIYSIPEGLDDGDNAGLKHRPCHGSSPNSTLEV